MDRQITISVGASRRDTQWKQQLLSVSELYQRLQQPMRTNESFAAYCAMSKAQQSDLKDVGGFVGGALIGGRRKASAVQFRDVVTLDFDNIPGWKTDDIIAACDKMMVSYCVYSTRKHCANKPRLRVVIPLDRSVSPDEYEPIARRLASYIGIQYADPTTFQPERLMYWPSCSADAEYVYHTGLATSPLASADMVLGTYADWKAISSWPQVPGAAPNLQVLATKQGDPESKKGIVGAFCRTYDIYSAMSAFLPGIYDPVDGDGVRFTYTGGSTAGGAVVYDNGKFLYSHHATDPCSSKLVNAFDLVRLHKFGDQDDNAAEDTPVNRLPSYTAMTQLAHADKAVADRLAVEAYDAAARDFVTVQPPEGIVVNLPAQGTLGPAQPTDAELEAADKTWLTKLARKDSGIVKSTIDNVLIILENDIRFKGRFALNSFSGRGEVLAALPWNADRKRRMWSDTDSNGMYWTLEKLYQITGRAAIDAALDIHAATHAFNEVQQYLDPLEWDGVPRLDTLLVDYLGAEDSPYTAAVTRKMFTAAVARCYEPGTKFDNMLILCGAQGLGKSTLLDKMSHGWFNDSIRTFEGKDASELLPGVWLVEVAELDAFRLSDVSRVKQFLSLRADRYRAAYGRNVQELPRRCVFFGTCNETTFLRDTTGNRRFWPVNVGCHDTDKKVWSDLTDDVIAQVWAEAKMRWKCGESLYLSGEIEFTARAVQEAHRETSPKEGLIRDFLAKEVPDDWAKRDLSRRRDFWAGGDRGSYTMIKRDRICALEVWCELFNGAAKDIKPGDVREINAVLSNLPEWQKNPRTQRFGPYGVQRGFNALDV